MQKVVTVEVKETELNDCIDVLKQSKTNYDVMGFGKVNGKERLAFFFEDVKSASIFRGIFTGEPIDNQAN